MPRFPGFEVALPLAFEAAVGRVTDGLKAEGFGVITRMDVKSVLHDKLGVRVRPYTILGACHPRIAHDALAVRSEVGLLLPCNVTVEQTEAQGALVRFLNPLAMLTLGGLEREPRIVALMQETGMSLQRVADALRAHANTIQL
jgi:uncharacterized protein (DUF302 family)